MSSDLKERVEQALTSDFLLNDVLNDVLNKRRVGQSGTQWIGLCPFHQEKEPSFSMCVDASKPLATSLLCNCKGCHTSFNLFSFIKQNKGVQKPLLWLADQLNITYDKNITNVISQQDVDKFQSQLIANKELLSLLLRKVDMEVIEELKIGYDVEGRLYRDKSGNLKRQGKNNYIIPIYDKYGFVSDAVSWNIKKTGSTDSRPYLTGMSSAKIYPVSSLQSDTVYIMEGESDLLLALSKGLPAITNSFGAGTWKEEWASEFKDKHVIIVMDIDESGRKGANKRVASLLGKAKTVKNVVLPLDIEKYPTGDFKNYIKDERNSLDAFLQLCAQTEVLEDKPEVHITLGDEAKDDEIAEYIQQLRNFIYVPELGSGDQIETSGFYEYQDSGEYEGVWRRRSRDCMTPVVYAILRENNIKISTRKINEIIGLLAMVAERKSSDFKFNKDISKVVMNNGVFDYATRQLSPFSKEMYSTIKINRDYDPSATCEVWESAVDDWTESDPELKKVLQEIVCYCVTDIKMRGEAWFLHGEGGDGKSQIAKILELLVNPKNCAFQSFHDLSNPFNLIQIKDKLINIGSEISSTKFATTETFKKATTGDTVSARDLHQSFVNFTPICKFIFLGNHLPKVSDTSDGWARRLCVFPFTRQFKGSEQNTDLTEGKKLLYQELPGIFNWALEPYERMLKTKEFTYSEKVQLTKKEYLESSNPIQMFINEYYDVCDAMMNHPKEKVSDFCDNFREWAKEQGYRAGSERTSSTWSNNYIGKEVKRITGYKTYVSHSTRYYLGLSCRGILGDENEKKGGRSFGYDVVD